MKNTSRTTKKLLAVFMVVVMAFSAVAFVSSASDESDADDTAYYKYVINYTDEQIDSVDVYTAKGGTATHITDAKNAIWDFSNGYGPFNSSYVAIDKTTGTTGMRLNPADLTETLDGESYTMADYNIVWLIPTVYWSATSTALTLTNDSTETGVQAYAHTIGGTVYPYIGIGVYEAGSEEVNSTTMLTSQSGVSPLANQNIATFDTYAHNANGNTILWNFYQWTFTKMATYMVGMGKNSQQIWGAGLTSGSASATTGLGNASGPYVSGATTYSKVFIENSWGSVNEWVGDTVFSDRVLYAGQNASGITYTATTGKTAGSTLPSNGWITTTSKNSADWDLPTASTSTSNATSTSVPGDYVYSYSGTHVFCVGGYWSLDTTAGVACAYGDFDSSNAYMLIGSRLAYYFDADPASNPTYTLAITTDGTGYGTVSNSTVPDVDKGTMITINGNTLSIATSPATTITATPLADTTQYDYGFTNWTVGGNAISGTVAVTSNMTIQANFSRDTQTYTITWKNYDGTTLETDTNIAYGTTPTYDGATPTKTATAQYTYTFDTWTPTIVAVTGDATYTATFTETLRGYTVTWKNYDGTTLETDTNIAYGTTPTYDGATPTKTATAQYTYTFDTWTPTIVAVTGDATYTATYTQGASVYNVTVVANNDEYGTITNGTFTDIPYGTAITINGNEVTIGTSGTATATENTDTPQYTYGFTDFTVSPSGSTVSADTTITANFTRAVNEYTITWSIDGVTTTETYEYGQTPTHANPTKEGYTFTGWNPTIASVTGDQTYTAQFEVNVYTVTWNANGGNVSPTSSTGSIETAVTVPTPTRDNFTFAGWYDAASEGNALVTPYYPTADITYYAHWTATLYTITFDATTNGGTTEATTLQGTVETPVTLPTATKDGEHFDGWWTSNTSTGTRVGFADDLYYPTADITLVAKFNENPVYTNSLNFNANGGYGSPVTLTNSSDTPEAFEFTIPDTVPYRYLYDFVGWASTSTATEREYTAGDTIEVASGESVTLYAVWVAQDEHNQFKSLIDTIPIIVAVGLILGVVGLFIRFGNEGGISVANISASTLSSAIVGVAVAVLVFAFVMLPLLSGL